MAKKSEKQPEPEKSTTLHELEKFTTRKIHRSEIKKADYNPRTITADARRKLRAGLQKIGMIQPITWNERNGNLVGGHRRLEIMDAVHGSPDYMLTVAVVDLGDKEEREANILLNNTAAQGDFDLTKLEELYRQGLDAAAIGWDQADVYRMFGEATQASGGAAPGAEAAPTPEAKKQVEQALERIMKFDRTTEEAKATARARDNADFFLVVVFPSYEARLEFTEARGLEDNRYQSAEAIASPPIAPPAPAEE